MDWSAASLEIGGTLLIVAVGLGFLGHQCWEKAKRNRAMDEEIRQARAENPIRRIQFPERDTPRPL